MPAKPPAQSILRTLDAEAQRLRWRMGASIALLVAAAWGLPLALAALLDLAWPWRESAALATVLAVSAAALAGLAVILWRRRHSWPGVAAVAARLEQAHPPFMDALHTAVELAGTPAAEQHPLNRALLAQVQRQLGELPLTRLLGAPPAVRARTAVLTVLMLAAWAWLLASPLGHKAAAHLHERLTGIPTGLLVTPGDVEVPQGDDLTVSAQVTRGHDQARLLLDGQRGHFEYDMPDTAPGRHAFTIAAVDEDFVYQVVTPTLSSRRYALHIFVKPAVQTVTFRLTPPAYTGQPPQEVREWRDLRAPVGSQVQVELTTNVPATAALVPVGAAPLPFAAVPGDAANTARLSFTLSQSLTYRLSLADRHGHTVPGPREYKLEAIPDYPPVVQVLTPEDNAVRPPDGTVDFALKVTDDYGVGEVALCYAINGGDLVRVPLWQATPAAPPTLTTSPTHQLALAKLVQEGDIIAYYGEALDQAQPQPQRGSSDVRFIEIRPDPKQATPPKAAGGGGGPPQSLQVSDLIEDQKQLIRSTFALRQAAAGVREQQLPTLARSASDLRLATTQRYQEARQKAGDNALGPVGDLFSAAIDHMSRAESKLGAKLPDESLAPQQRALAKLIAIEIELVRNSQQGKGEGKGKSQSPPEPSPEKQNQQDAKDREKLQKLQQQAAELEHLIQRQQRLNDLVRDRQAGSGGQVGDLAPRQEQLATDAAAAALGLRATEEARPAAAEVAHGGEQMQGARQAMGHEESGTAAKAGRQAQQHLERARELLGDAIRDLESGRLDALRKKLETAQQQQEKLNQQTSDAAGGQEGAPDPKALAGDQGKLREDVSKLLDQAQEAGNALEAQHPDAAATLAQGVRAAGDTNLLGAMKRAENALRYGRAEKATAPQAQATQDLTKLAESLAAARAQVGAATPQELEHSLQQLLADRQALEQGKGADGGQRAGLRGQSAQHLGELAGRVPDPALKKLAQTGAGAVGDAQSDGHSDQLMMAVLEQAAAAVEQRLLQGAMSERVRLSRAAGHNAPEEYRKLVDEYFKNLSNLGN